jgi:hypothetical protein
MVVQETQEDKAETRKDWPTPVLIDLEMGGGGASDGGGRSSIS